MSEQFSVTTEHMFTTVDGDTHLLKTDTCYSRSWCDALKLMVYRFKDTHYQIPKGLVDESLTEPHPCNKDMVIIRKEKISHSFSMCNGKRLDH